MAQLVYWAFCRSFDTLCWSTKSVCSAFSQRKKVGQLCDFREKSRQNVRHKIFHRKDIQRNTITKKEGFIIGPLVNFFDRAKTVTAGHNLEHLTIYRKPLVSKRLDCWASAPDVCTKTPGLTLLTNLWLVTAPRLGSYKPPSVTSDKERNKLLPSGPLRTQVDEKQFGTNNDTQ